jgi:hypothetical protein
MNQDLFRERLQRRLPALVNRAIGNPLTIHGDALDKLRLASQLRDLASQLEQEALGEISYEVLGASKNVA